MQVFKDFKEKSESLFISNEGLKNLILNYDPAKPQKNIEWTTDITLELPIKLRIEGLGQNLFFC